MNKRPAAVTTLLWMVLCLTAWNVIRLGASIADWNILAEFAPRPGPLYVALSASAWTLGGLALWRVIRRRSPRARLYAAAFSIGYAAWWWADRLWLKSSHPNDPFALVATLVLLLFVAFLLIHPHTRTYFQPRETHEQNPEDRKTA